MGHGSAVKPDYYTAILFAFFGRLARVLELHEEPALFQLIIF
jgi:hypothetical protein